MCGGARQCNWDQTRRRAAAALTPRPHSLVWQPAAILSPLRSPVLHTTVTAEQTDT